jgi:hypothetical protein
LYLQFQRRIHDLAEDGHEHICNHMPRDSTSSEGAADDVIEIVATYLK